ncbi:MAG: hypothetical protein GWN61_03245, partial [candidate division Zixibacteria bacterium]|nr:hypothetical protein [candidate division KSB1 bacterium]NIR63056.1 hypothetical protein [candidate division Zixibacteria bacterium]NIW43981.1 hypothetical protein [Gammaproteobacteria bacterium]NIS45068.1 hypothetical protein [candidate division Zixibacteria bacterium]NIT70215.1 hypothetical protein [candidate division KSB1 bacterium]
PNQLFPFAYFVSYGQLILQPLKKPVLIFPEAALSFFELLNIRMIWGIMINTAQTAGYLLAGLEYPHLILPAGTAITLFCPAFYMVGRALDEVVNPRLREL